MAIDRILFNLAAAQQNVLEKSALIPAGADPMMSNATGGGGMPPGAPPGMPADLGMVSSTPLAPAGADLSTAVQTAVQSAMQQSPMSQGAGGKPPKADINTIATDMFQIKKLLYALFQHQQWPLPPGLLDGPGRDPVTGMPAGTPTGGSDPAGSQPALPPSAIAPISPMPGAFPQPPLENAKAAAVRWPVGSVFADDSSSYNAKAQALARLFHRSSRNGNGR